MILLQSLLISSNASFPENLSLKETKQNLIGFRENHLYIAKKSNYSWREEANFNFLVEDVFVENDSLLVMLSGDKNYSYNLITKKQESYTYIDCLSTFFSYSIDSILISNRQSNCVFSQTEELRYTNITDGKYTYLSSHESSIGGLSGSKKGVVKLQQRQLENILLDINHQTFQKPDLSDFGITKADIRRFKQNIEIYRHRRFNTSSDRKQYLSFLKKYKKTITPSILLKAFNVQDECGYGSGQFNVQILNANGEVLTIQKEYCRNPSPWYLPLTISYKGKYFKSYSIALARFLKGCFETAELSPPVEWDNAYLLFRLAESIDKGKNNMP